MNRYITKDDELNVFAIGRDALLLIAFAIIVAIIWPLRSVPTGSRGVITVGGAIRGIESEGYTMLAPWQQLTLFSIRSEQTDIVNARGATSDTQPVTTNLTVRYSISPDKVTEVFEKFSHNGDLTNYIFTATLETFKAVTARYTAPELISKRPQVSADISALLSTKVALYGAHVINIDMTNFEFEKAYMDAINAKVNQEQLRQAADNKLRTVESEQKQKVAIAEAEATAVKATADGNAYAKLKVATAEAQSLQVQNDALAKNKDVLDLRRIEVERLKAERWNGALPTAIYAGAPIPFMSAK